MNKTKILLVVIVILGATLRLYRLDSVPPSLSWDEAANGYNAWAISQYGKDEYGKTYPSTFQSFGDDKHPVHIYISAVFAKLLGLNEFATRLPAALFGVFNVILIFYLAKILFKNDLIALSSSLFLAISPYNIHFSRFSHEANFALFFFILGIYLFFLSLTKRGFFLPLSTLSFGITFITYHPAKIVVPFSVLLLTFFYIKEIWKQKVVLLPSFIILMIFASLIFFNPRLLGFARASQTVQGSEEIEKTWVFQRTKNEWLGRINLAASQYSWHFSPQYLFISGDKNPRLSSQSTGEFYKIDAVFLLLGILYLVTKRSRISFLLLGWVLIAPLPSSLVAEAPHAARAMFMMGSWHIISALGLFSIIKSVNRPLIRLTVALATIIILTFSLTNYVNYYYGEYIKRYAIEWQYGMKQIVEFVKANVEYNQVFTTDVRFQPYIFFLYYLKTPLPEYLATVIYNNSQSKSYNNVVSFSKFYFGGGWDPIESLPIEGTLYVISPSQYDGLKYKSSFNVEKVISYPNGTSAFYLVTKKDD